ncbi:MAG: prolyl oligopeptidase family serine peptidase, partial [Saprospiraceae bacterium]
MQPTSVKNFLLAFCLLAFAACGSDPKPKTVIDFKTIPVAYPNTRQDSSVQDTYFGTTVRDPYRWLEDDQSAETKQWVKDQNAVAFGFLEQIPFRAKLKERLEQIWNFEKYGTPFKKAGRYYFFKNDGLQNQSVLYRQETLDGEAKMVLDPNTFSADGTTSLQEYSFSKDGRYFAYAISEGGSDWRTILVKNMETGEMLPDQLKWSKFTGIGWAGDGFHYTRYPEPKAGDALKGANQRSAVYFHKLGTPQSADRLVHSDRKNPDHYFGAGTTDDERFLFVSGAESTSGNTLAFKDLSKPTSALTPISTKFDHDFEVVENLGDQLLVLTNHSAPNQRLILVHTAKPAEANWQTLVPEDSLDVLQSAAVCGGKIVCSYLHNASSALRVFGIDGKLIKEVALPEIGTVGAMQGSPDDPQAFFSFASFLRTATIFTLDMNTLEPKVFKAPKLDFNPDAFTTEQVWFASKDGTRVPMFITRKKNIAMDGQNPTLLYGYGGFNISVTPGFSASRAALLENNGIYA